MKTICLDTNIIIRFLQKDSEDLSPKAKKFFDSASTGNLKIYLDEVVVAETVWVLSSYYEISQAKIAGQIGKLVGQKWVINPRKKIILNALKRFSDSHLNYIDCWLLEICRQKKLGLETFDKALQLQR